MSSVIDKPHQRDELRQTLSALQRAGRKGAPVMIMHSPPHPGRIVRQECLEPLGLSVTQAAKILGVSRFSLSELVNGRRGISAEMAIRLAKAFGSRPETWAGLQMQYDLAQAMRKADSIKVSRVPHPA